MNRLLVLPIVTVEGLDLWLGSARVQPDPQSPPRFPAVANDEG
jgi:hypothetical protein